MCGKCENWVFGALGLVVVLVHFLGMDAMMVKWIAVVAGAVVAFLGFWGAFKKHKSSAPAAS